MKYELLKLSDTKVIRLIVDRRYRITRHVLFLLGILFMISLSNEVLEYSGTCRVYRLLLISGGIISLSYINMYVLVPRLFFKGRYILYLALLVLLVWLCLWMVSSLLNGFVPEQFGSHIRRRGFYEGIIILIPIILVTTMIKLLQRWARDNERIVELKNITLTMELNELRNQINPHFLFNMLNGIKALVRSDSEKANIAIMKLSDFLRYQLYENNEEMTLLKSEVHFLSNFLELEKFRRDNLSVSVSCVTDSQSINSVFLPPNLFTTFVENAIKHSVNISESDSYIRATIEILDNKLVFTCINSRDPEYRASEKHGGLGLANIRRRLELLYGENYLLDTRSTEDEYIIKLTIPI